MKRWIGLLLTLQVFAAYGAEESEEPSPSQEIATLEPIELVPPLSSEEMLPPAPLAPSSYRSPWLAGLLSACSPGLGHLYLGDVKMTLGIAGSVSLGLTTVMAQGGGDHSLRLMGAAVAQNSWSYGVYAAYRDARLYNKGSSYSYPMPTDTLKDLIAAPFQPSVLKKPEVWGGFLGAFALAATTAYFAYPQDAHISPTLSAGTHLSLDPLVAFPVGIGEEALFRGYLQSQIAEVTTPWTGILVSSLVFGAAHVQNAAFLEPEHRWRYYSFSLPLITGLGAYFGWMTHKNRSLKESTALHIWYDFVLMSAAWFATQTAAVRVPTSFSISIPF